MLDERRDTITLAAESAPGCPFTSERGARALCDAAPSTSAAFGEHAAAECERVACTSTDGDLAGIGGIGKDGGGSDDEKFRIPAELWSGSSAFLGAESEASALSVARRISNGSFPSRRRLFVWSITASPCMTDRTDVWVGGLGKDEGGRLLGSERAGFGAAERETEAFEAW
jgi:hypothetical protein